MKGPLAGPLFENFWIQETVKYFLHHGQCPPLFYLRTASGLEVDLLVDKTMGNPIPVEIKLNKTPSVSLAQSLVKFSEAFPQLAPDESILLTLTDRTVPLTRHITAVSFDDFLNRSLSAMIVYDSLP